MDDEVVTIGLSAPYAPIESLERYQPQATEDTIDISISRKHTLDDAIKTLQA